MKKEEMHYINSIDSEIVQKINNLFQGKKNVALFTHPTPDPDAIASMLIMQWILKRKFDIQSKIYYAGSVSHPQNRAMNNLLEPEMLSSSQFDEDKFDATVLVDTIPEFSSNKNIKYDLVIDHHVQSPSKDFEGIFVKSKLGSCTAIICKILKALELEFKEDNEEDARIATAATVGIYTDTGNLLSVDCTIDDLESYREVFGVSNKSLLYKIVNFEMPRPWIEMMSKASLKSEIKNGVAVVGMGIISSKNRDIISLMASQMSLWEGVNTAIAFAIVNKNEIQGSIRSASSGVSVDEKCRELAGKTYGNGGGKFGKGGYKIELAAGAIQDDEPEDIRQKTWELFEVKEKARIFRIFDN